MTEENIERVLKDAVELCVNNAERFINDAILLLDNGSYGHAFALAVLAEEEFAKGCAYYASSEGILPKDFLKEVGRTRDSHIMKLAIGLGIMRAHEQIVMKKTVGDMNFEKLAERVKALQKNKERGLYVDVDLEKEVLSSPDSLKKGEVEKYLSELKVVFEAAKPYLALPLLLTQSQRKLVKAFMEKLVSLSRS